MSWGLAVWVGWILVAALFVRMLWIGVRAGRVRPDALIRGPREASEPPESER